MASVTDKKKFASKSYGRNIGIMMALAEVLLLGYLIYSPAWGVILRWGIAIGSLFVCGWIIRDANSLQGILGIYLIGGKHGIDFVDMLSKHRQAFWRTLSDWGLVMSFGVVAYFIFRKQISKRTFAVGLISLILIQFLLFNFLQQTATLINLPAITSNLPIGASAYQFSINTNLSWIGWATLIITAIGGFAAYLLSLIYGFAIWTLYGIGVFLVGFLNHQPNYTILTSQVPGIAPVIPGIDIPLYAGILALAFLLIIHEFSHGALARIYKVKIKSIGLALLGIIPIGAYVEPDEKQVNKLNKEGQDRISIAGISANFLATIAFLVLTIVFLIFVIPHIIVSQVVVAAVLPNAPASNILEPGMVLLKFNNYTVQNTSSIVAAEQHYGPNANLSIVTNNGTFVIKSNSTGKIGFAAEQIYKPKNGLIPRFGNFLYTFILLSLLLNFIVGAVNLLPVPSFDGWRIYSTNIKNKKLLKIILISVIISLVILILPWFWRLG